MPLVRFFRAATAIRIRMPSAAYCVMRSILINRKFVREVESGKIRCVEVTPSLFAVSALAARFQGDIQANADGSSAVESFVR
jgi:hypothetical protein